MTDDLPTRPLARFSTPLKATALVLFAISLIIILRLLVRPTLDPSNRTVVVMPFENLGDAGDAFLADGISEEIAEQLALLPGVKVLGRDGIRGVTVATMRPREVAATLGAQYVLSGTVQWEHATGDSVNGDARLTIVPELMEASVGERVWTQSIAEPLRDVARTQATIVERVADALSLTLTPAQRTKLAQRDSARASARIDQLRARGLARQGSLANLRRADSLYRRVVTVDSSYARAWQGLGEVQRLLRLAGDSSAAPAVRTADATRAAARAMSLDSASALVRYTYALALTDQFQFSPALVAVNGAIALDSSLAVAWVLKSELLTVLARLPEAADAATIAATNDRVSAKAHTMRAAVFLTGGAADSAVTSAERAVALAPGDPTPIHMLRAAYVAAGRTGDAVKQCEGASEGQPCRALYSALGGDSTARAQALTWIKSASPAIMPLSERAGMLAQLGDHDAAFTALQQALESHDDRLPVAIAMPWLQTLRADARWGAFSRQLRGDSAASPASAPRP